MLTASRHALVTVGTTNDSDSGSGSGSGSSHSSDLDFREEDNEEASDFDERDYAKVVEEELFGTSSDEDSSSDEEEDDVSAACDQNMCLTGQLKSSRDLYRRKRREPLLRPS